MRPSPFDTLPPELIELILEKLPAKDLLTSKLVNKRFKDTTCIRKLLLRTPAYIHYHEKTRRTHELFGNSYNFPPKILHLVVDEKKVPAKLFDLPTFHWLTEKTEKLTLDVVSFDNAPRNFLTHFSVLKSLHCNNYATVSKFIYDRELDEIFVDTLTLEGISMVLGHVKEGRIRAKKIQIGTIICLRYLRRDCDLSFLEPEVIKFIKYFDIGKLKITKNFNILGDDQMISLNEITEFTANTPLTSFNDHYFHFYIKCMWNLRNLTLEPRYDGCFFFHSIICKLEKVQKISLNLVFHRDFQGYCERCFLNLFKCFPNLKENEVIEHMQKQAGIIRNRLDSMKRFAWTTWNENGEEEITYWYDEVQDDGEDLWALGLLDEDEEEALTNYELAAYYDYPDYRNPEIEELVNGFNIGE